MSYNKRVWINQPGNASTGAIVCFSGLSNWTDREGNREVAHFIEISDCHCKIKLHYGQYDTKDEYVEKLRLLKDTIGDYIVYLENTNE